MLNRIVIVGGIISAMAWWWGTSPVPDWALVAFVVFLFAMSIAISVKRMRAERDLARTWRGTWRQDS
jgi:hypothetical protein